MLIRNIGGAPFIISNELYESEPYHAYSYTLPTYTYQNLLNAFATLLTNYPAIQRGVFQGGVTCPIVSGWNDPIQASTTWTEILLAARGAGLYTNIVGNVPVGGISVTYPDGTAGTFTGILVGDSAQSNLDGVGYTIHQILTITNDQYNLPVYRIMVLPESIINADDEIDLSLAGTLNVHSLLFSSYYRPNIRQLVIIAGMERYATPLSSMTKLAGYTVTNKTDDPYINILDEPSTTGGGHGTGDFSTDIIAESDVPTVSAIDSGFISVYSPSLAQLNALASYMWTSNFQTNLAKLFGDNAMGTIIGLGVIPVTPPIGGSRNVVLGNVDTGIAMPVVTGQYVKVDCGSVTLLPKYDAFLDYEPYTGVDLFLPYIGTVQLSVNDVMGKTIRVVYIVDVISGACVAEVLCNGSVYYTFNGCCLTQLPVTNNDYSNVFHSAIQAAISLSGAIAGAFGGSVGSVVSGVAGAADAAINAHPVVNRSGSVAGSCGAMGVQTPFLIMSVPKMVDANAQNAYIGYPNYTTVYLSGISGYTEVENINVTGLHATQEEQDEIKRLLKEGVIL